MHLQWGYLLESTPGGRMKLVWLGLAAIAVIAWFYLRRRSAAGKPDEPAATGQAQDTKFHAVSIKYGKDACEAAKNVTGQRFLGDEAPRLPLPGCDAEVCECRFVHHDDRRSGKDRRSPFGGGSVGAGTGRFDQERRTARDRRKSGGSGNPR